MAFIDIIIPAYNCMDTISNTVHSLFESGLNDFSVLIIDDGSNDRTLEVCKKLACEYDNIRYFHQENAGVSAARNTGIQQATGKYVLFVDADDTIEAGSLKPVQSILMQNQPEMVIFGMYFDYYFNGKVYRTDTLCYPVEACYSLEQVYVHFDALYQNNALTSSCNKVILRSILEENNVKYSEKLFLMEDFLFSMDCIKYCKTIYTYPRPVYRYRQTEDEGNVNRRLHRIDNLPEYMNAFAACLESQPHIFSLIYYTLLRQKLRYSSISEIKEAAEIHIAGGIVPLDVNDLVLHQQLVGRKYLRIFLSNQKMNLRHRIAIVVKAFLYNTLGGDHGK